MLWQPFVILDQNFTAFADESIFCRAQLLEYLKKEQTKFVLEKREAQ